MMRAPLMVKSLLTGAAVAICCAGMPIKSAGLESHAITNTSQPGRAATASVAQTRILQLPKGLQLTNDAAARIGAPDFGSSLPTPVWGYAISNLDTHRVVAGRMRFALLEDELSIPTSIRFGPSLNIRPGTYLLTTIGGSRRIIDSLALPANARTGRATPHAYRLFTDLLSQSGLEVHPTTSTTFENVDRMWTVFGLASSSENGLSYASSFSCLVPNTSLTCADKVISQETLGLLPALSNGSVATNYTQPNSSPNGPYTRLFESTTGSLQTVVAGFWLGVQTPANTTRP